MATTEWQGLAQKIHTGGVPNEARFGKRYPWKDNAWIVFWDAERRISGMIHCSTSFNGAPRTARAVLAYDGRVRSVDEVPDVGSLSAPSIDVAHTHAPQGAERGPHHIRAKGADFAFDLEITPCRPALDWTQLHLIPALGEAPELDHWQQSFNAIGHIEMNGVRVPFHGQGFRDRTWGWRAESQQWLELYGVNIVLEKCEVSMAKFLLADGNAIAGGYVQTDESRHVIRSSTMIYTKAGLAQQILIRADDLPELALNAGPADAGWWLTFNKGGSQAPVWTEFHHLTTYECGAWGKGYGCVAHDVLRRLS